MIFIGAVAILFGTSYIRLLVQLLFIAQWKSEEIVQTLKEHDVDWIVFAGWMRIVTQVLVDAFPHKIINLHPSLLPSFPGIRGVEQALEAQVKITGCSVHLVELEVDRGPILMQAAVPILPDDTPETLHARIQIQEHKILIGAISLVSQWQNAIN